MPPTWVGHIPPRTPRSGKLPDASRSTTSSSTSPSTTSGSPGPSLRSARKGTAPAAEWEGADERDALAPVHVPEPVVEPQHGRVAGLGPGVQLTQTVGRRPLQGAALQVGGD